MLASPLARQRCICQQETKKYYCSPLPFLELAKYNLQIPCFTWTSGYSNEVDSHRQYMLYQINSDYGISWDATFLYPVSHCLKSCVSWNYAPLSPCRMYPVYLVISTSCIILKYSRCLKFWKDSLANGSRTQRNTIVLCKHFWASVAYRCSLWTPAIFSQSLLEN